MWNVNAMVLIVLFFNLLVFVVVVVERYQNCNVDQDKRTNDNVHGNKFAWFYWLQIFSDSNYDGKHTFRLLCSITIIIIIPFSLGKSEKVKDENDSLIFVWSPM